MAGFSLVFHRLLGLLSQTMGRLDLAAEHYEEALEVRPKSATR